MGKLAGLLSSGIGLAMEAAAPSTSSTTSGKKSTYPDRLAAKTSNGYASSIAIRQDRYTPSRDSSEEPGRYLDNARAYHDMQNYADFQKSLADEDRNDSARDGYYFSRDSLATRSRDESPYYPYDTNDRMGASQAGRLERPIIIPQRRPEDKSRGWLRAYPPALMDYGIDERKFMKFLDAFNEKCKASPYLDAVNLAAFGVGFAPGIAPMVVSMVVPVAVHAAKKAQTNSQSKSYLVTANKEFFAPHGLFAMVMTWKPDQQSQICSVDSSAPSASSGSRDIDSSARTASNFQLPPAAELVFPTTAPENARYDDNKFLKMSHFVADYGDRRAQAVYAQKNPDSGLVVGPTPQFRSRWGDPTNPANQGGLVSMLTGRARAPSTSSNASDSDTDKKRDRRRRRRRRRGSEDDSPRRQGLLHSVVGGAMARRNGDGGARNDERMGLIGGARRAIGGQGAENQSLIGGLKGRVNGPGNEKQGLIKGLKAKGMQSDVLYLLIVDASTGDSIPSSPHRSTSQYSSQSISQYPSQYPCQYPPQMTYSPSQYSSPRRPSSTAISASALSPRMVTVAPDTNWTASYESPPQRIYELPDGATDDMYPSEPRLGSGWRQRSVSEWGARAGSGSPPPMYSERDNEAEMEAARMRGNYYGGRRGNGDFCVAPL